MSDDKVDAPRAMAKWSDEVSAYIAAQGSAVEAMRAHVMPSEPWPDRDNAMLAYLIDAALEPLGDGAPEEVKASVVWLAVHAWFEGALDQAARSVEAITG